MIFAAILHEQYVKPIWEQRCFLDRFPTVYTLKSSVHVCRFITGTFLRFHFLRHWFLFLSENISVAEMYYRDSQTFFSL